MMQFFASADHVMPRHFKYTEAPSVHRSDFDNLRALFPYLWEFRGRVLLAMVALVLAKVANVGVPLVLKEIVDSLDVSATDLALILPVMLLLAYGALRMASSFFNELRDVLFTRVRYRAMRRLTIRTLRHLHDLSLRYHLERKTGAISADLQRGAGSLSSLLNYFTFSIIPVAVELVLIAVVLISQYDLVFTVIIFCSVAVYVLFTLKVMNWRSAWITGSAPGAAAWSSPSVLRRLYSVWRRFLWAASSGQSGHSRPARTARPCGRPDSAAR